MSKEKRSTFDDISALLGHGAEMVRAETEQQAQEQPPQPAAQPKATVPVVEAPETVPGRLGNVPADRQVQMNFKVDAWLRHEFNLLLYKAGTDQQKVLRAFVKSCVESGRLPGGEES